MDYQVWIDGDGTPIVLNDMTDKHIKNCMRSIKKRLDNARGRIGDPNGDQSWLSPNWCLLYGSGFMEAFKSELNRRKDEY